MKQNLFGTSLDKRLWIYSKAKTFRPNGLIIKTNSPNSEFIITIDQIGVANATSDNNGIIKTSLTLLDNILVLTGTIEAIPRFIIENVFVVMESPHIPTLVENEITVFPKSLILSSPTSNDIDTDAIKVEWIPANFLPSDTLSVYLIINGDDEKIESGIKVSDKAYSIDASLLIPGLYKVKLITSDNIIVISDEFELIRTISLDNIGDVATSPKEITWSTVNVTSDKLIKLDLYNDETLVRELDIVENSGSYMWDNEEDEPLLAYSILATVVDMDIIWDRTNQFELIRSITLAQPITGLISNINYEIQWTSVNISASKTIRIEWIKGIETGLIAEVLNTGSYAWNNVMLDGGDYQIKLSLVEV